jgi:uncharacterized protein
MECPKCHTLLRSEQFGEVEVEQCPNCQGVWFDVGELRRVRQQRNTRYSLATEQSIRYDAITAPCPRCGGIGHMTRLNDLQRPDVVLESCPVCFGVWLDGGELDKLTERTLGLALKGFLRDLLEI